MAPHLICCGAHTCLEDEAASHSGMTTTTPVWQILEHDCCDSPHLKAYFSGVFCYPSFFSLQQYSTGVPNTLWQCLHPV